MRVCDPSIPVNNNIASEGKNLLHDDDECCDEL